VGHQCRLYACFYNHIFHLALVFLCFLSPSIERLNFDLFLPLLRRGIFFIALYEIFLFFYKIITGTFLLIPFLTTNYHDIETLEFGKSIAPGDFFKLISTYQNGNLYGLCLLMMLPLYTLIEKNHFKQMLVTASLMLTLSRTIWIGLFLYLMIQKFYIQRMRLKKIYSIFFFRYYYLHYRCYLY